MASLWTYVITIAATGKTSRLRATIETSKQYLLFIYCLYVCVVYAAFQANKVVYIYIYITTVTKRLMAVVKSFCLLFLASIRII